MPIEVKLIKRSHFGKEDLWCPCFVCDVCKKVICHYGNYEYKVAKDEDGDWEQSGIVYYTHKVCSRTLRYRLPEKDNELWFCNELAKLPMFLFLNLDDPKVTMDSPLPLYTYLCDARLSEFTSIENQELHRPGLYFLFDDEDLVYIGQSKNIANRLKNNHHIYQSHHRIRFATVRDDDKRQAIEKALILLLCPSLNTMNNCLA